MGGAGRPVRSPDTDAEDITEFAQGLRALRVSASLTLAELAELTHYAIGTLSDATSGKHNRLPSWDVTKAYVTACDGDVAEWRIRWEATTGRLAEQPRTGVASAAASTTSLTDENKRRSGPWTADPRRPARAAILVSTIGAVIAVLLVMVGVWVHPDANHSTATGLPTLYAAATGGLSQPSTSGESQTPAGSGASLMPPQPMKGNGISPPPAAQPATGATYPETAGSPTHTWTDYTNVGGTAGAIIASNATVEVSCKVQGFKVTDGNTWWYRVTSSPWNNTYYASADAFYNNGQQTGSLKGTPFVDNNVPDC